MSQELNIEGEVRRAQLEFALVFSQPSSHARSVRFESWYGSLSESSFAKPDVFRMAEFEAALKTQGRYIPARHKRGQRR